MNTPRTLADDPQFAARLGFLPREVLGAEQLPSPLKLVDDELPVPEKAPTVGQHTEAVLRDVLGYDADRIAALRSDGALG